MNANTYDWLPIFDTSAEICVTKTFYKLQPFHSLELTTWLLRFQPWHHNILRMQYNLWTYFCKETYINKYNAPLFQVNLYSHWIHVFPYYIDDDGMTSIDKMILIEKNRNFFGFSVCKGWKGFLLYFYPIFTLFFTLFLRCAHPVHLGYIARLDFNLYIMYNVKEHSHVHPLGPTPRIHKVDH